MTGTSFSKKNFILHDSKIVMKKNIGWMALAIFVFLMLIPFSTAGIPGDSIFEIATTHEQMKFRFIKDSFVLPVYGGIILYGIFQGLSLFHFLLKKEQCTFYFSLGITRGKLYVVRLLIGLLGLFLTISLPMLVSFAVNYLALGYYSGMGACCLYVAAGLFLQGGAAFLGTVLACMLAGTIKEALIFDGLFLGSLSCLIYGADKLLQNLVWGNSVGARYYSGNEEITASLLERMQGVNPLCFFYQNLKEYYMFYRGLTEANPAKFHVTLLFGWGIVLVLLAIAGLYLIRYRKAEQSGAEMFHRLFHHLFLFVISITIFSGIFVLFYENNAMVAGVLGFLSAALFLLLWQKIVWHQEKAGKLFLRSFTCMVFTVLVSFLFITGANIELQKLPEESMVKKASVSYVGHPSYIYEETTGTSAGSNFYTNTLYDFTEQTDIHTVLSLHRQMKELGMKKKEYHNDDFAGTVVPYDICFTYELENGKTMTWYYDRASLSVLEKMLCLDETERVKEGIQEMMNGTLETGDATVWASGAYHGGTIYLSDIWYTHPYELEMNEEERAELLNALAQDLAGQTIESRYFPEKEAQGVLLFTANGESDLDTFSYQLGNAVIYLTEDFTNTLDYIEKNQWEECIAFEGTIESITLQQYNPYDGINGRKNPLSNLFLSYKQNSLDAFLVQKDYGTKTPITDEERIAALLPRLRSVYNMTRSGYLAAIKIAGQEGYVYKYLPGDL